MSTEQSWWFLCQYQHWTGSQCNRACSSGLTRGNVGVVLTGEGEVHAGQSGRAEKILSSRIKQAVIAIAGWRQICLYALDFVSIVSRHRRCSSHAQRPGPETPIEYAKHEQCPLEVKSKCLLEAGKCSRRMKVKFYETETGRMSSSTLARWLMHRSAGAISSSRCCQTGRHQHQTTRPRALRSGFWGVGKWGSSAGEVAGERLRACETDKSAAAASANQMIVRHPGRCACQP